MRLTPVYLDLYTEPSWRGNVVRERESLDLTFTPSLAHCCSDSHYLGCSLNINWGALRSTDPQAAQTPGRGMEPMHLRFLELPR